MCRTCATLAMTCKTFCIVERSKVKPYSGTRRLGYFFDAMPEKAEAMGAHKRSDCANGRLLMACAKNSPETAEGNTEPVE